jgi:hypothetical protein
VYFYNPALPLVGGETDTTCETADFLKVVLQAEHFSGFLSQLKSGDGNLVY